MSPGLLSVRRVLCNGRETHGVNTDMNVKTRRDKVRWFGESGFQAVAADSNELASAIEDFVRDYPLARGRREGLRYRLHLGPLSRRMHAVQIEPSAPDGATLEVTIPVGRPLARRAPLTKIGWPLERASSGTRHYIRRFIANDAAPTEIVNAVDEANRALYGTLANDIRWSVRVSAMSIQDDAPDEASGSWDVPCLLASFVIGGILTVLLIVAFYVLVNVGVERFVEWAGPGFVRLFIGLLGLSMFGLGSWALFNVFTGRPMAVSKTRAVIASLFFVLLGIGFIFLAVVASDPTSF